MKGKSSPRIRLGDYKPPRHLHIDVCSATQRCRCLFNDSGRHDGIHVRSFRPRYENAGLALVRTDSLVFFVRTSKEPSREGSASQPDRHRIKTR